MSMGELGFNKILGAVLATALIIFGLNEVSAFMFGGGGHHGDHHYESENEWAASNFKGYRIQIAETTSGGGDPEEDVFDLGLLLANADAAAGETVLRRQCATCHSWNEGGANGTGPNLYGVMGREIASTSTGFGYSSALSGVGGSWTYEQMNEWLTNPGAFARGTSMAYAGLRSPRRDADRVNLIAYLASSDPNAPAFPEPLAAPVEDAVELLEETVEGIEPISAEDVTDTVTGAIEEATEAGETAAGNLLDQVVEAAENAGETVAEEAGDLIDAAEEAAEETDGGH